MKSILQRTEECYFCATTKNLHLHHVIHGIANRKLSDEDGLTVYLCWNHHEGSFGVHGINGKEIDTMLKEKAQEVWQRYYGKSKEDFIKRYGRSYL